MQTPTIKKKILGLAYLAAERYIVSVKAGNDAYKIFQIIFNKKDGSLHLNFPYFIHKEGILSELSFPAHGGASVDLSFLPGGKVTTHRVKYSHHVSGEALFSQDGKIYSKIRKQSVSLRNQIGHIFTIQVGRIQSFEKASVKDQVSTNSRTVLTFETDEVPRAAKFVGMWYSTRLLKKNFRGVKNDKTKGMLLSPNGTLREGLLLVTPYLDNGDKFALVIYGEVSPSKDEKEFLTFMGGFDAPETVYDHTKETKVLSLMYPAFDAEKLAKQIGSIDLK
jgi:hypothetical protein